MPETILIVGDNTAQLRTAEEAVSQKLRYNTMTARGGQAAIQWIISGQRPSPDLILLDLLMPGIDGIQVIRTLRACRPQLPIIVLGRYGEDGTRAVSQAMQAGVDDFLTIPVPLTRLRISIANALKLRRMAARLEQLERGASFPGSAARTSSNLDGDGPETLTLIDTHGRVKTLKALEDEAIRFVLRRTGGSMTRTARNLGIGRSTLYRRLDELGIAGEIPREKPTADHVYLRMPEPVE